MDVNDKTQIQFYLFIHIYNILVSILTGHSFFTIIVYQVRLITL